MSTQAGEYTSLDTTITFKWTTVFEKKEAQSVHVSRMSYFLFLFVVLWKTYILKL